MNCAIADRKRQSGAALLLLMLVVIIAASAVLVSRLSNQATRLSRLTETQAVLAEARQALLEYAVTYADRSPGSPVQLPCPDLDDTGPTLDGEAHSASCGAAGVTMIGRLPWRTLELPAPLDGSGECIWYAVSGEHKAAGAATAALINTDTHGLLQLFSREDDSIIDGLTAEERPVAVLMAPLAPLAGQTRPAVSLPGQQCSDNFVVADYLDFDSNTGISNAVVAVTPDTLSEFVSSITRNDELNDQVLTISGLDFAASIHGRHDFDANMENLTSIVAQCVASYAQQNPAAPADKRMPWPAPMALPDYRPDTNYDDQDAGVLSGRLPNSVDDSNLVTGNPVANMLTDCDTVTVPAWTPEVRQLWQHWKDHFFIAVAESFGPNASVPNVCSSCLTVNGSGQYAAVVMFAGRPLESAAQSRTAPPLDADARSQISNYLENNNATNHPYSSGGADYVMQPASTAFNDSVYCIDGSLNVSSC